MSAADTDLVRVLLGKVRQSISVRNYAVTVVTAAAARDGHAQVSIGVAGQNVPAPYLDSYLTPTVGDVVQVLTVFGSPLILGRPIGLPSF